MDVRIVPAKQGWTWITQGWQIFRRQPMALAAVLAVYVLAMLVVGAIVNFIEAGLAKMVPLLLARAIAGVLAACFAATVPGVTAGFMEACRRVVAKEPLNLGVLIEPFRKDRRIRRNLFVLGFVQVAALFLVLALSPNFAADSPSDLSPQTSRDPVKNPSGPSSSPRPAQPPRSSGSGAGDKTQPRAAVREKAGENAAKNAGAAADEQLLAERKKALWVGLFQMLLYLPVTIALWYAPMLVYWHGYGASKAMFFSAAAVWRNRGAFTIYGLALVGCLFVAAYAVAALLALFGLAFGVGKLSIALLLPFSMFLFTWTYCTIYITYTSVFVEPGDAAPDPVRE